MENITIDKSKFPLNDLLVRCLEVYYDIDLLWKGSIKAFNINKVDKYSSEAVGDNINHGCNELLLKYKLFVYLAYASFKSR